jgi:hypothetical protein
MIDALAYSAYDHGNLSWYNFQFLDRFGQLRLLELAGGEYVSFQIGDTRYNQFCLDATAATKTDWVTMRSYRPDKALAPRRRCLSPARTIGGATNLITSLSCRQLLSRIETQLAATTHYKFA